VVTRDQWGPRAPGAQPEIATALVRRYRCQACGAVFRVRPAGVLKRYRYAGAAILLALTLWGLECLPARRVRAQVSPWQRFGAASADVWRSLPRWVRDASARKLPLFAVAAPSSWSPRRLAARLVQAACAELPGTVRAEVAFARGAQLR
jgi:hypothetical protein